MWSSVAASTSRGAAESGAADTTADLNASLLECMGEDQHKNLRKLCGRLLRNDVGVEEFHRDALAYFKLGKGEPMVIYRRLVLSLPDGDKRAHLVSLCDEAVAKEKAMKDAAPVPDPPGTSDDTKLTPPDIKVETSSPADAGAGVSSSQNSAAKSADEVQDPAGRSESASASETPPEDPASAIVQTKAAVESKEKAILTVMARRQADLAKEKRALDIIRTEMATVVQQQSKEIQDVMTKLGETDKDLWYVERDYKAAEIEYLRCKSRFEKMKAQKDDLAATLTNLTLNAEKKKEAKLNSIMEKLRNDGVVFPGAALANIADP